jgi:hypothetical protein
MASGLEARSDFVTSRDEFGLCWDNLLQRAT